jgi:ABC-type glycerol-3-phosphate transport system substrate-binding protein
VSVADLRERNRPGAATTSIPATEAVTITFAVPREHIAAYRRAADAFREHGGSARVQVVAREDFVDTGRAETTNLWSQMRQIARRVDALAGPEVAALVRSGRAESSLYDLTELTRSLAADDFYPNMLESLQWSNRQWALPDRTSPYVIYYNRWMFDQMGVPYPEPGWTWEEFAQTASRVTRQGEDKIKWWGARDGLGNQLLILAGAAGPLVDYTVTPPRPLLDTPAVINAARRYSALIRRGYLTVPDMLVSGVESGIGQLYGTVAPDDAAMWVGLADLGKLDDLQRSGIGAVQFPVSNPGGDTPIEIQNALAVSAASPHPEAAWEWLRFLSGYGTADSRGPGAPARRVILFDGNNSVAPASLDVYQAALWRAQPVSPLRTEEYHAQRALRDAISRLARGEEDATAVMQNAQGAAEANIRR